MSDNLVPIENSTGFRRDLHSKAVLNTNKNAYLRAREEAQKKKQEIEEMQQLKTDVAELKDLLNKLLEKVG